MQNIRHTILKELPKPAIIAHRGASAYAPENTLPAFRLAVQQQADAIELDVQLSADGYVVVIHDKMVDRTTNGSGVVSALSLADLKKLDAGSAHGAAFQGEKIPILAEVFEAIGEEIFINIEIKGTVTSSKKLTNNITKCVKNHNMTSRVLFSSYNPIALRQIAKLLPEVPRGLLVYGGVMGFWARTCLRGLVPHQTLHINRQSAEKNTIDRVQRQGRRVFVYTVNAPSDIRRLIELGVDGIFTDDPYLALQETAKASAS